MGDIYVGTNDLLGLGIAGHAFVGFRFDGRVIEVHGAPEGGASPGGFYAGIGDSTMISVGPRSQTPNPAQTITVGSGIPDDLVEAIAEKVLKDADAVFRNREYTIPGETNSNGDIVSGNKIQTGNSVAEYSLARAAQLAKACGYDIKVPSKEAITAGLYSLPGYSEDLNPASTVGLREAVEKIRAHNKEVAEMVGTVTGDPALREIFDIREIVKNNLWQDNVASPAKGAYGPGETKVVPTPDGGFVEVRVIGTVQTPAGPQQVWQGSTSFPTQCVLPGVTA